MMKKLFISVAVVVFMAVLSACTPTDESMPESDEAPTGRVSTSIPSTPVAESADTRTQPFRPAIEPGIPAIVDTLDFELPAGNGHYPYRVAVDTQRRRLYTFNQGLSTSAAGNTISVIELDTEQVTALVELNNLFPGVTYPPSPLALQVDPYRPRLYALWGDRFADPLATSLTIIDSESLTIIDTLPGVDAFAVGPNRLYMANDTRLWTVNPTSLAEMDRRKLAPRQFNDPLLLNTEANRLYLGRGAPWSVEIFAADSLTLVDSHPIADDLAQVTLDKTNQRLLIIAGDDNSVELSFLDQNGQPLEKPSPIALNGYIYTTLPLALTEKLLYLVDNDGSFHYHLRVFNLSRLTALDNLPLPSRPNDLTIDPNTGLLYAVYSSPDSYIQVIDPTTGDTQIVFTALNIADALADPNSGQLYLLNNDGALQILSLAENRRLDRVETGHHKTFKSLGYAGQLSLDTGRRRLYISGDPVRIVNTESLEVTTYSGTIGQVTPDPTGDWVYLTPPCRCREEQCNTLILKADTLTDAGMLFPPEDPLSAPCVLKTMLDDENQLLYATIYNGVPGSNSGTYFSVFDTQPDSPEQIYTDSQISFGNVAIDPLGPRAFIPRYRMDRSFIHRLEAQDRTVAETLVLAGAQGELSYDPAFDRLYAVSDNSLQVFDGDLTLLAEIALPGEFEPLAFDPQGQRLYLHGQDARLLIVATGGGRLEPPLPGPVSTDTADDYVQKLVVAPDGTRFRLAGSRLYRSRDQGQTWQRLGAGLPNHLVNDLALSPGYEQDQTLLAGLWSYGRSGGLYRSTDGGDTWLPTTRGLTDLEVQQIAFSPTFGEDQTIFVATLAHGLFRSSDGGDTWESLAGNYARDSHDRQVSHLAVSPTFATDGLLIIGYNTLLRSTDGGQTWTDTGLPAGLTAFSPNFARDGLILSAGRWRSTDRGQTWQPAAAGLEPAIQTLSILFSPRFDTDQTVYILQQPDYRSLPTLQRSVDAGRTWQSLAGGLPAKVDLTAAAILPGGDLSLNGRAGQDLTVSPADLSWTQPSVDMTGLDLQALAVAPNGHIFVANSAAGVFKSLDGGRTWQDTGFPARASDLQPARLAIAADGALFAAAGTALEGSPDSGGSWSHLTNLPAGFTVASLAVSPNFSNDGLVLAGGTYSHNQLLRSTDRGESWEVAFAGDSLDEFASDLSLIAFSPNFGVDGRVYAWLQEGGLLRSTDSGRSWTLVAEDYSQYFGQSLAVGPGGDRLYLGGLDGRLLVSTDEGETWTDLQENIPGSRMWSSALAFGPDGTIFLGTDIGVFRSRDEGQTWAGVNAGLPLDAIDNTPVSIRALEFAGERLYAALTEGGLFFSDDRGQSWQSTTTADEPGSGAQAASTPTPSPASQPSVSPAACATTPAYFGDLWAERVAQLGCPTDGRTVTMVEQTFEGGRMFWRSDLAAIYVLPADQPYARFDDTWNETQPAYGCPEFGPAQTPPTPQRGFGKIWCTETLLRELLGAATSEEKPFTATLQEFETGLIFQLDGQDTYILENQSNG